MDTAFNGDATWLQVAAMTSLLILLLLILVLVTYVTVRTEVPETKPVCAEHAVTAAVSG